MIQKDVYSKKATTKEATQPWHVLWTHLSIWKPDQQQTRHLHMCVPISADLWSLGPASVCCVLARCPQMDNWVRKLKAPRQKSLLVPITRMQVAWRTSQPRKQTTLSNLETSHSLKKILDLHPAHASCKVFPLLVSTHPVTGWKKSPVSKCALQSTQC